MIMKMVDLKFVGLSQSLDLEQKARGSYLLTHSNSRQRGRKEPQGVVKWRGRIRLALLGLDLRYAACFCAQRTNRCITKIDTC